MKKSPHLPSVRFAASLLFGAVLGLAPAWGEGEVGTPAFQWTGFSNLAPSPTTYSLSQYQGKVVLMVVFQHNCGGCLANADEIGRLVDTLDRGPDSAKFQAVGTEIATANYAQIQTYRNALTVNGALTLSFPLVKVPNDTNIRTNDASVENQTRWKRYNAPRDMFFVIGHDGLIKARVAGNRQTAMGNVKYDSIRTAIHTALAAAPASLGAGSASAAGFRADRIGRGYYFRMNDAFSGTITLRITDLQGRVVRRLALTPASSEVVWNGQDAAGNTVPFGMYFVQATGRDFSARLRISMLP
jgi:peroxiredoxin